MRSISWKMLLAFIVVILGGTVLFFVVARQYSNHEIREYLFVQDKSSIAKWLAVQYEKNGSWEDLGKSDKSQPPSQFTPKNKNSQDDFGAVSPFILVDQNMVVVQGMPSGTDSEYVVGNQLDEDDLINVLEITLDGKVIGWLLNPPNDFSRSNWGHPVLERLDELLLISAGGAMVLALVLAMVFSRSLSRPLKELSAAAQAAATGDLSKKVEIKSKDEIGVLANSFNQMMEDLEILISSRRQMTADIAHELRTPISVILGYTEAVHEGVLQPDKKTFEIVHDEALRLERLVKDLRLISQADVGELPLDIQRVPVDVILGEVEKMSGGLTIDKEITFEIVRPQALPEINVDSNRIIQVLRNVIENGARYTPNQGKITLFVEVIGDAWVRFSIQDEGPGAPEDDLSRIFDRFYQVDTSRTRNASGSGLGLAIARSIIEQHDGKIWAENSSDKGLKIIFTLPVA